MNLRDEFEMECSRLEREGLKYHPLRQDYEQKVALLAAKADQLRQEGTDDEAAARQLFNERRELGRIFKEAAPVLFREYIYYATWKKYGDPLGPGYDQLRKKKSAAAIIESSSRPIADLDNRLSLNGFREWFETKRIQGRDEMRSYDGVE